MKMAKQGRYLNDDVFFDVLSWLPAKTLVGLKLVSKGWLDLISDLCFVRTQLQKTKLTLSGFVFQQKFQWSNEDIKTTSYISLGGENDFFPVNHTVFDFLPDDVVVLASCNGLVCCRSCFPTQDPAVYICNPVNKQWLTLKWAELEQGSNIALASDPRQGFKLVTVKKLENEEDEEQEQEMFRFGFEIYCSETGAWTRAKEVCESRANLSKSPSSYVNGTVHWLTRGGEILTFGVESELPWLISAPVPASELNRSPRSCIGGSGGRLHYATVSELGLSLWRLEDRFESRWVLEHWVSLETIEKEYPDFFCNLSGRVSQEAAGGVNADAPWVNPLAFQEDALLMRVSTKLYLYRFDSGEVREVCDASELGSSSMFFPTVVPYSMSLVPLPSRA